MSKPDENWELLEVVTGALQAEILRGLLEAGEIQVLLFQEGAGKVYGVNIGTLGAVQIFVPKSDLHQAKAILAKYQSGDLEEDPAER